MPARGHGIKIPRCSDLTVKPIRIPAPRRVARVIGEASLVVGVDIETHGWKDGPGEKGTHGPFGFFTRSNSDLSYARIVQIGWAVLDGSEGPNVKERLIKPEGFEIEHKATQFHGITQEHALSHGSSLSDVMSEFIQDMIGLAERGARLVIHSLEFDAGIIHHELDRAGLRWAQENWAKFARGGLCTMDPGIGKWIRESAALELANSHNANLLKLKTMVEALKIQLPIGQGKYHAAGFDAQVHALVYRALVVKVKDGLVVDKAAEA